MRIRPALALVLLFTLASYVFQKQSLINSGVGKTSGSLLREKWNAPLEDVSGHVDKSQPYRVFPKRNETSLPCYSTDQLTDHPISRTAGFYYIKIQKCASTTAASIALNIARRHTQQNQSQGCDISYEHIHASLIPDLRRRSKSNTLLWTFLRDPTSRFISHFYHTKVSKKGYNEHRIVKAAKEARGDFMYDYTQLVLPTDMQFFEVRSRRRSRKYVHEQDTVHGWDAVHGWSVTNSMIQTVLDQYDFIGLVERFHESLVVIKILWDLNYGDLLYMNAKESGGYDYLCNKIIKSNVSERVQLFFESKLWKSKVKGDEMFYAAVNRSLDLTIDQVIGKEVFDKELFAYNSLLQRAQDRCMPSTIFPCDEYGQKIDKTNCYNRDEGCGYECLDDFYARENL